MKNRMILGVLVVLIAVFFLACSKKSGCPAGGIGAEKHLDGSKVPKSKKFKA